MIGFRGIDDAPHAGERTSDVTKEAQEAANRRLYERGLCEQQQGHMLRAADTFNELLSQPLLLSVELVRQLLFATKTHGYGSPLGVCA